MTLCTGVIDVTGLIFVHNDSSLFRHCCTMTLTFLDIKKRVVKKVNLILPWLPLSPVVCSFFTVKRPWLEIYFLLWHKISKGCRRVSTFVIFLEAIKQSSIHFMSVHLLPLLKLDVEERSRDRVENSRLEQGFITYFTSMLCVSCIELLQLHWCYKSDSDWKYVKEQRKEKSKKLVLWTSTDAW